MIVSVLIAALAALAIYVGSHRLGGAATAVALLVATFGAVLVLFPSLTSRIALALGVGRGTDLLLYFAIVCGLFLTANFYFRFKRQGEAIATLTRALALSEASRDAATREDPPA